MLTKSPTARLGNKKHEKVDPLFVLCAHLSFQQRKRKEKKSISIAALPENPQESPPSVCLQGCYMPGQLWVAQQIHTNLPCQMTWPRVIKMADEEGRIEEYLGYIYMTQIVTPTS